jgi:hypothetical protein
MSDEEFLARWSRRKREAERAVDAPPPAELAETPNPAPSAPTDTPADAELDIANLPPIESITGATDITAFLRKGIPPELSRAALRRAWAADPAIRDFVGLAENAWDFNDPNAMPGFGPLDYSAEQLAALLDKVIGGARSAADGLATAISEETQGTESADHEAIAGPTADIPETPADDGPPAPVAVQTEANQNVESDETTARRRTHGSALPR